ncbi:Uncharacterised protein [Mycobacteroides abscessus subsp. abscessus]|nr:Uncharacterised protein [Mycobacteroides abscessus subsp. abscessus]
MHRWIANAAGGISHRLKSFGATIADRESTEAMGTLFVCASRVVDDGEGKRCANAVRWEPRSSHTD